MALKSNAMTENKHLKIYTKNEVLKSESPFNARQVELLVKKTPARYIKKRKAKGGGTWDFVEGTYVTKMLNLLFGFNWSHEVRDFKILGPEDGDMAIVLGRLSVPDGAGGFIIKEQFGRAEIKRKRDGVRSPLDIGNDLKAATTDSLKKCASLIGIASDVYGQDSFDGIIVDSPEEKENLELNSVLSYLEKIKGDKASLEAFKQSAAFQKYKDHKDIKAAL